ncbi:MAG: MFS transporter [Geminicoccaceae bacterium]
MLSTALSSRLAAKDIHYGWVVVGVTFLTMLATAGALSAPGVMIVPLQREFGWQNGEISSALALRLVLFGLIGPFAAAFMNRYGVRPVVGVALTLIVAGLLGSFLMTEVWQLVLLWGIVVGLGSGMMALVLGATIATRWFVERRGLVVGMLTASTATGQLVFLPMLAALTERYGWRIGLCLVLAGLLLAMALVLLLLRDRPSDVGLAPYGATDIVPAPAQEQGLRTLLMAPLVALRAASGSRTFWVLFATFFVCGLSTNGLIQTHWITLCGDFGVLPVLAASVLAGIGIFDFVGTVLSGWLSDRYDNRWLLFWYYGLRGLALLFLPFTEFTFYGLAFFTVLYGLDWVATVPPTVRMTAERFGAEKANITFGWVFAGHQLGAAVAAFGAGTTRDVFNTYMPALIVAGIMCLVAAGLVLALDKHRPGHRKPSPEPEGGRLRPEGAPA